MAAARTVLGRRAHARGVQHRRGARSPRCSTPPRSALAAHGQPCYGVVHGFKGSVVFHDRPATNYREFLAIDTAVSHLHYLVQYNNGVFTAPWAKTESWTLSVMHTTADAERFVDQRRPGRGDARPPSPTATPTCSRWAASRDHLVRHRELSILNCSWVGCSKDGSRSSRVPDAGSVVSTRCCWHPRVRRSWSTTSAAAPTVREATRGPPARSSTEIVAAGGRPSPTPTTSATGTVPRRLVRAGGRRVRPARRADQQRRDPARPDARQPVGGRVGRRHARQRQGPRGAAPPRRRLLARAGQGG